MPSTPTGATVITLVYTTGATLNAFPIGSSLATWATNKVLFAEAAAPNLGRYTASIPNTLGAEWYIFASATQPADWSSEIDSFDINESPDVYADSLLNRDMATVSVSNARSPINALRLLRNKVTRPTATGTMTVFAEDDATAAWTSAVIVTPNIGPITTSDPA